MNLKHFKYVAVDKKGRTVKGETDALSNQEVHTMLEGSGIYPISIEEASIPRLNLAKLNFSFGRVKQEELIIFTEQFATLISSGLSIVDSLDGLAEQTENKALKKVILNIRADIERGISLSNAFKKYNRIFPEIYVNLLAVGEATGNLDKVLRSIAGYLERDLSVRRKISSAFAYPRFVIIVVIAVVIFLVSFILPQFVSIYAQAGEGLPTPTKILLSISNFIRHNYLILIILVLLVYAGYRIFYSTKAGKLFIDRYKLNIPIFGKINKMGVLSRFLHSFALVIGSGINVVEAIEVSSKVSGNAYLVKELEEVKSAIIGGESLSAAVREIKFFPNIMSQMVSVGERSGSLDSMLEKLADLWDKDIDYMINTLSAKIEPTLIIILAFIVGFVALAMYLPMFSLPATYQKTL